MSSANAEAKPQIATSSGSLLPYLLIGVGFGVTATKSEIISWFRIQEMFRFQSFHMYGVICSAVAVALLGVQLLKRRRARTLAGEPIEVPAKTMGKGTRYWLGGALFGLGWGLAGACPGPMFTLIGNGFSIALILLASALLGAWTYAILRPRLPH
jgi:uncharacterized membrane protein YedE/YeeE